MKIFMPYHLGCGNRGCERIARGISKILELKQDQMVLFDISTEDYKGDLNVKLNEVGELKYPKQNKLFEIKRLFARVFQMMNISFFYNQLMSNYYIKEAKKGDWIFITGGDIYCYEGAAILPNLIVKKAKKKGINTALFGVSMEERFLTPNIVKGLKNYDIITTRETISEKTLNNHGLHNNLFPDPAFSLESIECELPSYFEKKVVGINFSPFTDTDVLFNENMTTLITFLLDRNYEVCLIPHVLWKNQDDRVSMKKFVDEFGNKIHILNTDQMSYLQIRYAISKCEYFIGGRTHSVISAYSTRVPCLALGYSVKAVGIAKDLGMPDYTVINSRKLINSHQLIDSFEKLEKNRELIMNIYDDLPNYISRFNGIRKTIKL